MRFDKEVPKKIMVELKRGIETESLCSEIEKDLKSSRNKLADLNKEYILQKKTKEQLQLEISQLEKDISGHNENMTKQKEIFEEKEKELNIGMEVISSQISYNGRQLANKMKEGNNIIKDINKLEPEVMPARRQVDAATREWEQAKKEVVDELVRQMGILLGDDPISSDDRLGPSNTKVYSQKWANLEPITHHQTGKVLNLQDHKYAKASQTILNRLAQVPKDRSQSFFWMRYAEIINRTIKVYNDPQPEGAQERLVTAFDKLNQANKIANAFLDLMYGKEQKASSSQEQA
jgi:hypothetical protein